MPRITFIDVNEVHRTIDADAGQSLMQAAVNNGIEAIVAECGGACACATCHLYVESQWLESTGPASEMEDALLDGVESRRRNSRLSCQINVTDELDGLVVRTPASQC